MLTGTSENWEVHVYMQKSGSTTVIIVPFTDVKLPNILSAMIQRSDPSKGLIYQKLPLVSGNTYQAHFPTDKSLYQHSDDLQFVISQENGDETITLSTDKTWHS